MQGFLTRRIHQTSIPHHKICFEITETAAIGDLNMAVHLVKSLKKLGCLFALDDFGSGLASFAYLKTLHVDFLKIDGSFVRDMLESGVDHAMVRAINEVGQVMGKKTIAEGVEDSRVMVMLGELGVDYVQGYTAGRPMPLRDFCRALAVDPGYESDSMPGAG
jgi:EAL domain-containing protein (putative c-di-GMP-specific phosphodiesterase class I)